MIDEALKEVWKWLRAAPLPVVLVLCLVSAGSAVEISRRNNAAAVAAATAASQEATTARKEAAEAKAADVYVQQRLTTIDTKMDNLLEAVGELKALQAQATAVAVAQARADERRRRDSQKPPQ